MLKVKEVVNAWNLVGDSVYVIGPLEEYIKTHSDIAVTVAKNLGGQYIDRHFRSRIPVLYADENQPVAELVDAATEIRIDVGKAFFSGKHIRAAYCDQLGVPWDGNCSVPMGPWVEDLPVEPNDDIIWIAPFSVSGITNKMIFRDECVPLIEQIRKKHLVVWLLGLTNYEPPISNLRTISANNIEDFIMMVRGCRMLICCDNGVSHLASAIGVKTRVLWKRCVAESWIAPIWGRDTKLRYSVDELISDIETA